MYRDRLVGAAAITVPFLLVLAVRSVGGLSPSLVTAAPPILDPAPAPDATIDPKLRTWLSALPIGPDLPSPLDHPDVGESQVAIDDRDPLTGVRLSSVLGSGGAGIAVINGELLRVGDQPAPGCEIVGIDARAQIVRIRLPDGRVRELIRD